MIGVFDVAVKPIQVNFLWQKPLVDAFLEICATHGLGGDTKHSVVGAAAVLALIEAGPVSQYELIRRAQAVKNLGESWEAAIEVAKANAVADVGKKPKRKSRQPKSPPRS